MRFVGANAGAADPAAEVQLSSPSPRALLCNALLFSISFAVLEGCITATIIISHAVVSQELAAAANAILYLFFSLTTFVSPAIVGGAGVKQALVGAMFAYSFYCAAYMVPSPPILYLAASLGGVAGAVLWTAQGVYYTVNALEYTAAHAAPLLDPATSCSSSALTAASPPAMPPVSARADSSHRIALPQTPAEASVPAPASAPPRQPMDGRGARRSLDLFAGLFAFFFNVSLALGKPLAGLCLTLWPENPAVLFGAYTAIALACSCGMALVRPLPAPPVRGTPAAFPKTRSDAQCARAAEMAPAIEGDAHKASPRAHVSGVPQACPVLQPAPGGLPMSSNPAVPAARVAPARAGIPRGSCGLCGAGSLCALLADGRMAMLVPTNSAFGLMTALFPSVVAPIIGDTFGTAAVGWCFAIAGATSTAATVGAAVASRWLVGGRSLALGMGALTFGAAATRLVVCSDECYALPRWQWLCVFIAYGTGVAVWQSSMMALVGEMHHAHPHAAFAHLKLTSGLSSFVGFYLLPKLAARDAAALCLAVVAVGALSLAALLSGPQTCFGCRRDGGEIPRRTSRLLSTIRPSAPVVRMGPASCGMDEQSVVGDGVGVEERAAQSFQLGERCRRPRL
jgi:hypothetical protein